MPAKKKVEQPKPRVNFPIVVSPRDNTKKTLPIWKMARDVAESIYYPVRKPLYDLYREIVLDTHVSSCIDKRILAVTNVSWAFMKDGEPVESVEKFLKSHAFEKLIIHIVESKLYGHSLIELNLSVASEPRTELVPRENVLPWQKVVVADPNIITEGFDYTKPPFDKTVIEVGEVEDLGLLYKVAPYVLLKKGDISDWATYCEVFGSPLRVGKYDPNMPGNETAVANALKNMGNNAWAALPQGSEFEYVTAQGSSGSGNDVYEKFADYCNSEISKCLNGQTMTAENGSSLSQAKVHKEILDDINMSDRRFVEKILNERFIPLLQKQGFSIPEGAQFTVIEEEETLTKKERLEIDLRIHKEVGRLKSEYFAQEYNIEFDENAEPVTPEKPEEPKPDPKKKEEVLSDVSSSVAENIKTWLQEHLPFFVKAPLTDPAGIGAITLNDLPEISSPGWLRNLNFIDGILSLRSMVKLTIRGIFEKGGTAFNSSLFDSTVDKLIGAVDEGFSKVNYGQPSFQLKQKLKESAIFFAASKTILQAQELSALLLRPDGTVRPWREFRDLATPIARQYNVTWLRAEYDAAVRAARSAKDFEKAQETIELYPNLKYMPSVSADPRDSHKQLYGIVRPVNDPFWNTHLPPSDWNCKCSVQPVTDEVTNIEDMELPAPVDAFAQNPARTGRLFSQEHPYFQKVGNLDATTNNIILREFQKLVKAKAKNGIVGKKVSNGAFQIEFTMKGIKEAANQPHKEPFKKLLMLYSSTEFLAAVKNAWYVGSAENTKHKAFEVLAWHYFKIDIGGSDSWLVMQERSPGILYFYSITDHMKTL